MGLRPIFIRSYKERAIGPLILIFHIKIKDYFKIKVIFYFIIKI